MSSGRRGKNSYEFANTATFLEPAWVVKTPLLFPHKHQTLGIRTSGPMLDTQLLYEADKGQMLAGLTDVLRLLATTTTQQTGGQTYADATRCMLYGGTPPSLVSVARYCCPRCPDVRCLVRSVAPGVGCSSADFTTTMYVSTSCACLLLIVRLICAAVTVWIQIFVTRLLPAHTIACKIPVFLRCRDRVQHVSAHTPRTCASLGIDQRHRIVHIELLKVIGV